MLSFFTALQIIGYVQVPFESQPDSILTLKASYVHRFPPAARSPSSESCCRDPDPHDFVLSPLSNGSLVHYWFQQVLFLYSEHLANTF